MSFLGIHNVTKRFGGLLANDHITFEVEEGEILGVIGPNGAGKTTLFNCISGVYRPNEGSITFKGERVSGLRAYDICKHGIARTFQLVQIFSDMTSLENVMIGTFLKSQTLDLASERALEFLKKLNLSDKKDILAGNLTLADRKKLEVARALATEPKLLLLDEVAGGLNTSEVHELIDMIKAIHASGITIVMIEHVMEAVMNIAGRIVVLDGGRKLSEGSPQEVVSDPRVIKAYLGDDYRA
jgi:branched-chain amino acid transport system ATP-binding protein